MAVQLALALEYFHPWPNSAGFYVAREHGWYTEAGIDLQIRTIDPGIGDSLEHLNRGIVDLAVFPTNRLLVRTERGEQLRAVASINHRGLETVRTLASARITSLADLAGRRIALNPTPRGIAIVKDLVRAAGGDPGAVIFVDAGAREYGSDELAAGVVDATFGSYWAWDILLTERPDRPERTWNVDEELPFSYHSYLLGAQSGWATENSDVLDAFLAVTERGFRRAVEQPTEAGAILATVTPYFAEETIAQSLAAISPTWFHNDQWGVIRDELVEPYAHWLASHHILTRPERWRDSVRASALLGAPLV